jgi:hypothetical protein
VVDVMLKMHYKTHLRASEVKKKIIGSLSFAMTVKDKRGEERKGRVGTLVELCRLARLLAYSLN